MFYTYAYFRFKRLHSCAKTFKSFDFQSFDYKSVPDEGYPRNASCALKLDIYVFIGIYFT